MLPGPTPVDRAFAALAHPVRRAIVDRLLDAGELTVGAIAAPYDMTNPTISRHLKILEKAALIERTVVGRTHHCRVSEAGIDAVAAWIRRHETFWRGQFDALERYLEDEARTHDE